MTEFTIGRHSFKWTSNHLSKDEMAVLKQSFDETGSKVVERLHSLAGKTPQNKDLYSLLQDHHSSDELLHNFWDDINRVPDWVDWDQIQRGQRFFYKYALANLMGFGLQGFMGENAASPGTAEILVRTGGFATRRLLRRLLETFQFLLQVTASLESIQPGGSGFVSTVRVRLLHSSVRNRVIKLAEQQPEYFDTTKFGMPINDLDSIHATTTFCCNHTWLQLPFLGVHPYKKETTDYIALFRYVAYLIGTPTQFFESVAKAKAVMESIGLHELQVTATSRVVGYNFVQCLTDLPPLNVSSSFIAAGCRSLNGDAFCDSLELEQPGLYAYACYRGFCWLVQLLCLFQHLFPSFDHLVTNYFRNALHEAVIYSKSGLAGGTKFDFQYIPELGSRTDKEGNNRKSPGAIFHRPVEAFLCTIFAIGCASIAIGLVCCFRLAQQYATISIN